MMPVVERHGTSIDAQGYIHHDDRPSTYEAAEAIVGRRLDRRKNYAIIDGEVAEQAQWSESCSGCSDDQSDKRGAGCSECGYTGRRRRGIWFPLPAQTLDAACSAEGVSDADG